MRSIVRSIIQLDIIIIIKKRLSKYYKRYPILYLRIEYIKAIRDIL